MGGGGVSGKVNFPDYMKNVHKDWLEVDPNGNTPLNTIGTSIVDAMDVALGAGGNPFDTVGLTDPQTKFTETKNRYNQYETVVDSLDEEIDWKSIIDTAVAKVDTVGVLKDIDFSSVALAAKNSTSDVFSDAVAAALTTIDEDIVANVVDQFERQSARQRTNSLNRFNSTMADINAVQSSAYLFGLALIESDHLRRVDDFQSQVNLQLLQQGTNNYAQIYSQELRDRLQSEIVSKTNRDSAVDRAVQTMTQVLINKVQFTDSSVRDLVEINRIESVGTTEFELKEIDLQHRFHTWDFEVFQSGMQVLAGMTGPAGSFPDRPSTASSAIGGAFGGAAQGALVGAAEGTAFGPGVGTAIGAVLGLTQGLLN